MPVGQTCTQIPQSTQSPSPWSLGFTDFGARPARLAALAVVGDDERVLVEHHALEPRVRAHVLAHLLAHPAGVAVRREAVEQDPERLPTVRAARSIARTPRSRIGVEIADERVAGPQRDREPRDVLQRLLHELLERQRRRVEADARQPIAFDLAFDPLEDFGVHRLRTRVAAPQAPGDRGEQEQRERGEDEEDREVDHVLRPEHPSEDVELARAEVEQDGLPVVPVQPRQPVEDRLRGEDEPPAPAREHAVHGARIDLLADLVERDLFRRRRRRGRRRDRQLLDGTVHGGLMVWARCGTVRAPRPLRRAARLRVRQSPHVRGQHLDLAVVEQILVRGHARDAFPARRDPW